MTHSVELLFDQDSDAAIRREWNALADAGLPSQARHRSPSNRPHVTLLAAGRVDPAADAALWEPARQLPLECVVGAPLVFGRSALTLVRLIVPAAGLLTLHESVGSLCAPYVSDGPFPHLRPGHWTPHVTLCRRLAHTDLPAALALLGADDLPATFAALRRWDGDAKVDTVIA